MLCCCAADSTEQELAVVASAEEGDPISLKQSLPSPAAPSTGARQLVSLDADEPIGASSADDNKAPSTIAASVEDVQLLGHDKTPVNRDWYWDELGHPGLDAFEEKWSKILASAKPKPRQPSKEKPGGSSEGQSIPLIDWEVEGSEEYIAQLKRITRSDMVRFLLVRLGNVDSAVQLAQSVAAWYTAVDPPTIPFPQIRSAVGQGLWRFGGWSKCGYPIILAKSAGWYPGQYYHPDEYTRYIAYVFRVIQETRMGAGVGKVILISDFDGFTMQMVRPIAMKCLLRLSFVLQEMCGERLAGCILVNTGFFRHAWPILKPFCLARTGIRMHWLSDADSRPFLTKFIDADILEKRFHGDYQGHYPAFTGNWDIDSVTEPPPPFDSQAPDMSPVDKSG